MRAKCVEKAQESDNLIDETQARQEWWWWLLQFAAVLAFLNGVVIFAVWAPGVVVAALALIGKKLALNSALSALSTAKTIASTKAAAAAAAEGGAVLGIGAVVASAVGLMWHLGAASSAAAPLAHQIGLTAALESARAAADVSHAEAVVSSLQTGFASLTAQCTAGLPFLCSGFLLITLALVGCAGRDLLKRLLGQLWAAEIDKHQQNGATFKHMEEVARDAAMKLKAVYEKNELLENTLDMVVGTAEEVAGRAQDAPFSTPEERDAEVLALHQQVDELCGVYQCLPRAFNQLSLSLHELQPPAERFQHAIQGHEHGQGQYSTGQNLLMDVVGDEDDEDWILIESVPVVPGSDCLPRNTYILIPVAEAARLGVLRAAGPDGNHIIEVQTQGPATRQLRRFSFDGSSVHELTFDHPIRVMRSGTWIQEQASTLRVGDVVMTFDGGQILRSLGSRLSHEEVFNLEVQNGSEIYVATTTRSSDGHLSLSGLAVLGSAEHTQRSRSAPPRWPSTLPSVGSRLCKGAARCSNICRSFKRGKCEKGEDCRFCHFPHPEESKRQPRGPRDGGSSRSSGSA